MEPELRKLLRSLLGVTLLLSTLATVSAADRVREFRGTGNTTTAIFQVEAPWVLDWRLDGDFNELVALDVTLDEAHTGRLGPAVDLEPP